MVVICWALVNSVSYQRRIGCFRLGCTLSVTSRMLEGVCALSVTLCRLKVVFNGVWSWDRLAVGSQDVRTPSVTLGKLTVIFNGVWTWDRLAVGSQSVCTPSVTCDMLVGSQDMCTPSVTCDRLVVVCRVCVHCQLNHVPSRETKNENVLMLTLK